ncbi:MAG: DEAD/DEAH box helicase [Candidatus Obscuribacter sp.]|nr:DEAD/DEAH box helicase [Candidatus Obscuribacter sp.]
MPTIAATINSEKLLAYFDEVTRDRGRRYHKGRRVISISAEQAQADSGQEWLVTGKVQGTSTYICELVLNSTGDEIRDCVCSCPMDYDCKHGAALALEYLANTSILRANPDALKPKTGSTSGASIASLATGAATPGGASAKLAASGQSPELSISMTNFGRAEVNLKEQALETEIPVQTLNPPLAKVLDEIAGKTAPKKESNQKHQVVYILESDGIEIRVQPLKAAIKKDGSCGRMSELNLYRFSTRYSTPDYVTNTDLNIFHLLQFLVPSFGYEKESFLIDCQNRELAKSAIKALIDTGRCFYTDDLKEPIKHGADVDVEPVWRKTQNKYEVKLQFGANLKISQIESIRPLSVLHYYNHATNEVGLWRNTGDEEILNKLAAIGPISREQLLAFQVNAAVRGLADKIPLAPEECRFATVKRNKELTLSLVPNKGASEKTESEKATSKSNTKSNAGKKGERAEAQKTDSATATGAKFTLAFPKNQTASSRRLVKNARGNMVLEIQDNSHAEALLGLEKAGFVPAPELFTNQLVYHAPPAVQLLKLAQDNFQELKQKGINVSSDTARALLPLELDEGNLEFKLEGKDDWWFSLSLNIDIDGKPQPLLPILLAALVKLEEQGLKVEDDTDISTIDPSNLDALNHEGKFVAQLESGRIVTLPFDRVKTILAALSELLNRDTSGDDRVPLSNLGLLLDYEGLANSRWFGADRVRSLFERLKGLLAPAAVSMPKKLKAELRPYQQEGLKWLQCLADNKFGGILADDMGLGKTVQLLAHIALEHEKKTLKAPFLVVCPTSVLPNWLAEAKKFTPHLKVHAHHGPERGDSMKELKSAHIVVTTYPLIGRDDQLQEITWHGIALDEAQTIKNPATKIAQAVTTLKAGQRFCMTGTPIENHLGELWSQFMFLLPGMLGNQTYFNKFVRRPIEKEGSIAVREALVNRIKPFILRRTKEDVAADLPPKTEIVTPVELAGSQRDFYETVRIACSKQVKEEIERKGFKMSQIMILDALLKLRQVCCDPSLVKLDNARKVKESAKLDVLMEMLEEIVAEGRKVIVFSQFKSMLEIIEERLTQTDVRFVKITGDTKDRATPVKEFQEGDAAVFLISLKAGGTGLNLTAADTVIHYDPWWNPAAEDQATDRAHRIGQEKNVFVYRLITQGTIEERMLELQARKRNLASQIIDGSLDSSARFTEEDLEKLLAPIV